MALELYVGEIVVHGLIFKNIDYPCESFKNMVFQVEEERIEKKKIDIIQNVINDCKMMLEENEIEEAAYKIIGLLNQFSSNKVLKKYIQDVVAKSKLIIPLIKASTSDISQQMEEKTCSIKKCLNLMNFISIMEVLPSYDHDEIIPFLFPVCYQIFEGFVYHLLKDNFHDFTTVVFKDFSSLINLILKQIALIFSKKMVYIDVISERYSASLAVLTYQTLSNANTSYEIKTKTGLIFVYSLSVIPQQYRKCLDYPHYPPLEILKNYYEGSHFTLLNNEIQFPKNHESVVFLFASILNVLPHEENIPDITVQGKKLTHLLFKGLMDCAKSNTNIPNLIVEISRILFIYSKNIKLLPLESMEELYPLGMSYITTHIEHYVDSVRNYVKPFFCELVLVAAKFYSDGHGKLATILVETIKQSEYSSVFRLFAYEYVSMHLGYCFLETYFPDLPKILLNTIVEPTITDQVTKTYIVVMSNQYNEEKDKTKWVETWVLPIIELLKSRMSNNFVGSFQKIFQKSFELHPIILHLIYSDDFKGNTHECGVLLKCLRYARNSGMKIDTEREINNTYWRGLIEKEMLEKFMYHQNDEVRITALAIIVESHKSTELFLEWELRNLSKYLHYNISSHIPNIRNQIEAFYIKALDRFSAGFQVIEKHIEIFNKKGNRTEDIEEYEQLKSSYKMFINNFTKQLISYLSIDSNYPRRVVSLQLLVYIQKLLKNEEWLDCWTKDDVKNCQNILFDGYENNKKMAVTLLRYLPPSYMGFTSIDSTSKYLEFCLNNALDCKPSRTLSVPYLLQTCLLSPYFLDVSRQKVSNPSTLSDNDPILNMMKVLANELLTQFKAGDNSCYHKVYHGIICSIRHLLQSRDIRNQNEAYPEFFKELAEICLEVKEEILPVVCNPSPEGYLPDFDDAFAETDESNRTQAIVVNAWRTIKEVTSLFAEMIRQTVKLERNIELLSENLINKIGEFFITIFIESKHRGVFEQAYIGFSEICKSFWSSTRINLNQRLQTWLKEAINLCTGVKQSEKLCWTRRSAGLPYLILSLFSSGPTFSRSRFPDTFTELCKFSETFTPKKKENCIHSLNIMRHMFRNTGLGEVVAPFIGKATTIAITNFANEDWGVRNSATLLFSALMTRIFGVNRATDPEEIPLKNKLTIRVFYMRYPELFEFLSQNLPLESKNTDSTMLQPILMILSRLYTSCFEEFNAQMEQFTAHLETCLSNQSYRTRYLAARASVSFINPDKIESRLKEISNNINQTTNSNETHGQLLQVFFILRTRVIPNTSCDEFISKSICILEYAGRKYSHNTVSLYMEILVLYLKKFPSYDNLDMLKKIIFLLSSQINSDIAPLTSKGNYYQNRSILIFYILINKFEESDLIYSTFSKHLLKKLRGNDAEMRRMCLNLIVYLHQTQNRHNKHPLFKVGELEIPQEVISLVETFEEKSTKKILIHIHGPVKDFLIDELKHVEKIKEEDKLLLFLTIYYYPCVFKNQSSINSSSYKLLINMCNCDNEETISATISCISTYVQSVNGKDLKYNELINILMESASPSVKEYRRLAVCDFFTSNYNLFGCPDSSFTEQHLETVLNILMVLLEDDDVLVRNTISNFIIIWKRWLTTHQNLEQILCDEKWPVISEKARDDVLQIAAFIQPKNRAICFLFSWACRHFPDQLHDSSEVFERGELNLYAENVPLIEICGKLLTKLLWNGDDLQDLQKRTLEVTNTLLNSISNYHSPMMLSNTKDSVICVLQEIAQFIETLNTSNQFKMNFEKYFNETVMVSLANRVEYSDITNVNRLIQHIYESVIKT